MEVLKPANLTNAALENLPIGVPLIVCSKSPRVDRILFEAGFKTIQINADLAKSLLDYPKEDRVQRVEKSFCKLLSGSQAFYITNFEMLFDPRYRIDVIKLFCERARVSRIAVKWPGQYSDIALTYANPGEADYQKYEFSQYQIKVVI